MFSPEEQDRELISRIMLRPNADAIASGVQGRLRRERAQRADFYAWLDEDRKAEFIEGEIVVHSPVRKHHADTTKWLTSLLDAHCTARDLGYVATEKILVKLERNDFEPDVAFWRQERSASFEADQLFFPAPDFVAEVLSPSTAPYDRGAKFRSYAAAGVAEYWIVDADLGRVECHALRQNLTYGDPAVRSPGQQLDSSVVTDFQVPVDSLFVREIHFATLRGFLGITKVLVFADNSEVSTHESDLTSSDPVFLSVL